MFFNVISTFQFNTETVQSHALNIKKLSEWITIEECHLGLSHCREITAIAFGFKTAQDLKEFLKESNLSILAISPTIESDLASAIQKFSKPIPFMSMKDEDIKDDYAKMLSAFSKNEEEKDSDLVKCQKFWCDWHIRFAKFLTKYFKETHGRFEWFDSLELIDLNCTCGNSVALCYGDEPEFTFLNLAIFNHLYTQYAGDCGNYIQGNKEVLFDNNVQDRIYIVSENLLTYIKDNWESIAFLKENTYDLNQPHILEYDVETKQAKLNLFLCKSRLGVNFYCPINYKGFNFGIAEGTYKSFLFNANDYGKPFSFTLPYADDSNFMRRLELNQGVVFTENDFVCAEISKSFAIQKLLEHHGHSFVTNGQFSELIFDLRWDKKDFFDVTQNSFKLNETFTAHYLFSKPLKKPALHEIEGRIERLQPILEVLIESRVYATLEISIKDSKISIELSNIKTKLSRFGQNIPVDVKFHTRNVDTDKTYGYSGEGMKYMVSALTNRNSFKKMLDAHLYIGPYKQFILKHLVADISRTHQRTTLVSLAKERAEMM
jgi:hypothetical protein